MMGMKEYVRSGDKYRIRVTEKAYNLFYRKQGFVPVIPESEKPVLPESDKEAVPDQDADTEPEFDKEAVPDQDADTEPKPDTETAPESDAAPKKKRTKKAPADEQ